MYKRPRLQPTHALTAATAVLMRVKEAYALKWKARATGAVGAKRGTFAQVGAAARIQGTLAH